MAYDPGTGQLVLFGGNDGSGPVADTWTWDGSSWTEQSPSTSPPARSDASMAYDPGTGQLVLFGGNDGSGPVADTWTWDGSSWTEQSPSTSPPARSDASMAYDPGTGQLVLFGGNDGSGPVADTWTWDGSSWTEQSPSTSPPARSDASMAYDPGTGQLVLFGGNDGSGPVADTWTWDGSSWTEQSPSTSPPARSDASMAYDPGTGQLVLFGGNDGHDVFDGGTWSFSLVKASQSITFVSSAPSSASYSGSNNQTYLVNANASSGLLVTFSIDSSSTSSSAISGSTVSYGERCRHLHHRCRRDRQWWISPGGTVTAELLHRPGVASHHALFVSSERCHSRRHYLHPDGFVVLGTYGSVLDRRHFFFRRVHNLG